MTATRLFDRAVIRLAPSEAGEHVTDFLQGLVTSDVAGVLPVWTALLTPQGKALFDFMVWPGENGALLIDCEADAAPALVKRLSLYRLRRKVSIEVDEGLGVHWQKEAGDHGVPDPRLGDLGTRWLAPTSDSDAAADTEWHAHRLSLAVPEGRAELGDGETLWLECNAAELQGVNFEKGCYVGQENTARMNWRQKINRRLLVVPLDRSDEKRRRIAYPDLGLAIDHLRVADLEPDLAPIWLKL
ncbi:folate-binding protein YgfZ [Altererythrobacter sp. ZODW24]|uniref:CAF17-like 4Fe-4S cluster assembly/insertion protein YgfZ n=1 Tax=Altererythrobacter sp. ZODW24 TaxID=2185142 RepID=UPI000DF77C34|nr:folate-binding protein YgfZ [Altererythrobacter sp. ZODW24]